MAKEKKKQDPGSVSEGGGFDMTPMIDVTFLLIIFFMIVTDITNRKPMLQLPVAVAAEEDIQEDPGRIVIHIHADGEVETSRGKLSEKQFDDMLRLEAVTSIKDGFPSRVVLIRADKHAKYEDVQQVMVNCMKYRLWRIAFSTKMERPN